MIKQKNEMIEIIEEKKKSKKEQKTSKQRVSNEKGKKKNENSFSLFCHHSTEVQRRRHLTSHVLMQNFSK